MVCPKCQFDNLADSIFCAECGRRLQFFCPACGTKVADEINYCMKCGHSLHVSPPSLLHTERWGEKEHVKEERHKEYYMPRVRSARIASALYDLLRLNGENMISDMGRDHFEHSLHRIFEDNWLSLHDDSDVSSFLNDYWQAIKEVWPEAFDNSNEYRLRGMAGFSILNNVFPDVIQLCRKVGDFSKEAMRQMLVQTGIGSEFWREKDLMRGDPESYIDGAVGYIKERLKIDLLGQNGAKGVDELRKSDARSYS
jgi:hypothetical protein